MTSGYNPGLIADYSFARSADFILLNVAIVPLCVLLVVHLWTMHGATKAIPAARRAPALADPIGVVADVRA